MNNKYILLRHGETIYQTKKNDFLYPWPDFVTSLTKRGKNQIEVAADKLKSKNITLIYSSDFLRTRQTAKIVAKKLDLRVKFDKRLRDINWGIYQDGPVEDYCQFFSSKKQKFSKRPPKGESWRDVRKRALDLIKDIEKENKNETVLIISHGDPLWLLIGAMKGLNEDELLKKRSEKFDPYKDFYPDVGEILEVK
jgi:isoleucyl-tRNA synthetase